MLLLALVFSGQNFLLDFSYTLKLFIVLGLAGIVGETLFSVWWHHFFSKRFWVYTEAPIFHGYTSLLNFIPWAIGGSIFLSIVKSMLGSIGGNFPGLEKIFSVTFLVGLVIQIVIFKTLVKTKFHKATLGSLVFIYSPIFLSIFTLWQTFGNQILWISLSFGTIACFTEYLFGKFIQSLLSKKLWLYTYVAVDGGHFTPLSIPFFTLAGFYFWIIVRIII